MCVSQWIEELRQSGEPDIVIILVGNKVDLVQKESTKREVPYETAAQFAERHGKCDCRKRDSESRDNLIAMLLIAVYETNKRQPDNNILLKPLLDFYFLLS